MATANAAGITLKGSTDIVSEFFEFGIHNILFLRNLYSADCFEREFHYDLPMMMVNDPEVKQYISNIMADVKQWLMHKTVKKFVIVITNVDTKEVIEKWQFNIECDKTVNETTIRDKSLKEIQKEIREVFQHIFHSVIYLPYLDCPCSFNLLVYTDKDMEIPSTWVETEAAEIENAQEIKFKSFGTSIHTIQQTVTYKLTEF